MTRDSNTFSRSGTACFAALLAGVLFSARRYHIPPRLISSVIFVAILTLVTSAQATPLESSHDETATPIRCEDIHPNAVVRKYIPYDEVRRSDELLSLTRNERISSRSSESLVEITPQGDLQIDGRKSSISPSARQLVHAYRNCRARFGDTVRNAIDVAVIFGNEVRSGQRFGEGAADQQQIKTEFALVMDAAESMCLHEFAFRDLQNRLMSTLPKLSSFLVTVTDSSLEECIHKVRAQACHLMNPSRDDASASDCSPPFPAGTYTPRK